MYKRRNLRRDHHTGHTLSIFKLANTYVVQVDGSFPRVDGLRHDASVVDDNVNFSKNLDGFFKGVCKAQVTSFDYFVVGKYCRFIEYNSIYVCIKIQKNRRKIFQRVPTKKKKKIVNAIILRI